MRCLFHAHVFRLSGFAKKQTLTIFNITTESTYAAHRVVVILILLFSDVSLMDIASRHG